MDTTAAFAPDTQPLQTSLRQDLSQAIAEGRWQPGELLPSYQQLASHFGGCTATIMKAVNALEQEGVLTRLSPRKIAVAENPPEVRTSLAVGLMNLRGHLYEDMAHGLVRRLYDRHITAATLDPIGDNETEIKRWFARFFREHYQALVLHDSIGMRHDLIEAYRHRYDRLILIETPFNQWQVPYHAWFIDRAWFVYDALCRLHRAGSRRIHLLFGSEPPGSTHHRDRFCTGWERFAAEHPEVELVRADPFILDRDVDQARAWARQVHRGEGVLAYSDYFIVLAQEWLHDCRQLPLEELRFVGCGNTPWSQRGVYRFTSYDFRLEEAMDQVLAWVDTPTHHPVARRIRPKLVRKELLSHSR